MALTLLWKNRHLLLLPLPLVLRMVPVALVVVARRRPPRAQGPC
jgi:hypothetical protein